MHSFCMSSKNKVHESTKEGTYEFREMEVASTQPTWVQVLCVHIIPISLVFIWNSWLWGQVGLWFLSLFLRNVSSCWVAVFNLDMIIFASFYYVLICHVKNKIQFLLKWKYNHIILFFLFPPPALPMYTPYPFLSHILWKVLLKTFAFQKKNRFGVLNSLMWENMLQMTLYSENHYSQVQN